MALSAVVAAAGKPKAVRTPAQRGDDMDSPGLRRKGRVLSKQTDSLPLSTATTLGPSEDRGPKEDQMYGYSVPWGSGLFNSGGTLSVPQQVKKTREFFSTTRTDPRRRGVAGHHLYDSAFNL